MIFPSTLIETMQTAQHIVISTGAGISAESGIPTFRQAQTGLWAQYNPEELATPQAFRRNPKLVWDWYAWRRGLVQSAKPNAGHTTIAQLEQFAPKLTLITQNVDNLHQEAGSQNVVELHGNLRRCKCSQCDHITTEWGAGTPPVCPTCGAFLRPDVVWFGEPLPAQAINHALEVSQTCDLFFSIGTSTLIYPAAHLPVLALQSGATAVEINPNETPLTRYVDFALTGSAGEILPALYQTLQR